MTSSLPVTLTLVFYPSSPRNIALHVIQKDDQDANNITPAGNIQPQSAVGATSQPEEIAIETESRETESAEGNTEESTAKRRRTRRTRAEIEADRLAQLQPADETGDNSAGDNDDRIAVPVSVTVDNTVPTSNPVTPKEPGKETEHTPPTPAAPEHAEPVSPTGVPPSELPKSPEQKLETGPSLTPYSHATTEQRRALLNVINHTTGMQFQVWKNNPAIYDVVKEFQKNLEGAPVVMNDPRGGVSLAPFVAEDLKKALEPVLVAAEEDTY